MSTNIETDKAREGEIMFILLIFSMEHEVDYYLIDVLRYVEFYAYVFVLDYLDYHNAW